MTNILISQKVCIAFLITPSSDQFSSGSFKWFTLQAFLELLILKIAYDSFVLHPISTKIGL